MQLSRFFTPWRLFARHRPNSARVMRGGRVADFGRLPRYALLFVLAAGGIWAPITAYVTLTPPNYTSDVSLILPGSGAQASVNLADLGQASSSAASAFSSSRISPTQTYKRLLAANRTLSKTADALEIAQEALGAPRIELVDETSLIHFSMKGGSPEDAQRRAAELLDVFLSEIEILRQDELVNREASAQGAIAEYEATVARLRSDIADLQAQSGLVSFAHYEEFVSDRDALEIKLAEARAERGAKDAQLQALSRRLGVSAERAAANLRLHADPEFQELARTLSESRSLLAVAQGRFGPRHPQVTSAVHKLSGAESELRARGAVLLGGEIVAADSALDMAPDPARAALFANLVELASLCENLRAAEAALAAQLGSANARLAELAPQAARLDDLSRDYQVAETVFSSALARVDTTKADVFASYPLVQVLADASLPVKPSSPKLLIAVAAGVAATFMILMGLFLAWIRRPLIDKLLAEPAA